MLNMQVTKVCFVHYFENKSKGVWTYTNETNIKLHGVYIVYKYNDNGVY